MTLIQRRTLESAAARDLPLNRAIRAMLEENDAQQREIHELQQQIRDERTRHQVNRSHPEGAKVRRCP